MRLSRNGIGAVLLLSGTLGVVVSFLTASTAGAQQSAGATYAGTASADGLRVTYSVDDFVVTDRFVDGGAPLAQAAVSTLESVAFASAPYPGEVVVTAPGLVTGAAGAPSAPAYPLVAASRYPAPEEQTVDHGVVHLASSSTASSSRASGAGGGPDDEAATAGASQATAEVVHDETNGTVTSTATTRTEAFSVAGVFRIGRATSTAQVVDAPEGDPQRSSSLDVGEVTIAGQTVALTEQGLALPGTSTPLPDGSPLLNALVDQGIEVRYLAAEETADGVIAPGLEVRVTHALPGSPSPGMLVYRFGQAAASATGGAGTLTAGGGVDGTSGAVDSGNATTPAADVGVGSVSAGAAAAMTPAGSTPTSGAGAASPSASAAGPAAVAPIVAVPQWARGWTMAFYLVIVLSGVVTVSGSQLIRVFGVRMPWTS